MIKLATFAAGCFWGVEAAYAGIPGVMSTQVGYSGGRVPHPSYEDVCGGDTGHAEAVMVEFDSDVVSFDELLEVFWSVHDPCSFDRQGPDVGSQYRSVIFYHSEEQRLKAIAAKDSLQRSGRCGGSPVATEIVPAADFYRAEEYHQRYHERRGMRCASTLPKDAVGRSGAGDD